MIGSNVVYAFSAVVMEVEVNKVFILLLGIDILWNENGFIIVERITSEAFEF